MTVTVSVNIQQVTLGAKQCLNGPPSAAQTIIVPAELETGISRKYGIWESGYSRSQTALKWFDLSGSLCFYLD